MKLKSKSSIKFFLGVVTFLLLFGGCSTLKNGAEDEQINIVAFWSVPAEFASPERYREMAECGFTHGVEPVPVTDIETMDAMLDAAETGGIKLFVNCFELRAEPEKTAEHFRNHPALAGYAITDEPPALLFPHLGKIVKRIQSVDAKHPSYINLFPNYATKEMLGTKTYKQHVDRFLAEVPVTFLSFDNYPTLDYRIRPDWYENLEIIAKAARNKGIPFWAFALASGHWSYPPVTIDQIRLQQFANLAYGAQTLQYYIYWEPDRVFDYYPILLDGTISETPSQWDPKGMFYDSPILADGTRGEIFEKVKKVNAEIQLLAGVFKNSKVIDLGHTGRKNFLHPDQASQPEGPIPTGTTHYEPTSPVKKLVAQGRLGVIVSTLTKANRRFLVIVNKDYAHITVLKIEFDGTKKIEIVTKDGKTKKLVDNTYKELINPAGITIFTWLED